MREFIHIWLGSELPDEYLLNIESTRKLMKPEDQAILISDRVQKIEVFKENELIEEMNKNGFSDIYLESFNRLIAQRNYTIETAKADFFRFYWCATRPHNVVYGDCDATILELPLQDEDKPCFAEYNIDRVDLSVITSHGCMAFFKTFLEETKGFPREQSLFYGWLNSKIDPRTYGKIPLDCFVHDGVWE